MNIRKELMTEKSKIVLVTQFYIPNDIERYQELKYCVKKNIKNPAIDQIILVIDEEIDDLLIPHSEKIKIERMEKRPTYGDLFNIAIESLKGEEGLMIVSNSDIFYYEEDVLKMLNSISFNESMALSRWEFIPGSDPIHHDTWDSQDTWVFKNTILPGEYDIKLGIPGCDNRIAFELQEAGYLVKNPSKSIKSYHYHVSKYRTYNDEDRIEEPYLFINTEE
jgi:hypothetical protein